MIAIADKNLNDCVFLDESGITLEMLPNYLRSKQGERVFISLSQYKNKKFSLIAALSPRKMLAPMVMEDAIDKLAFEAYVRNFLLPEMKRGQILIMDNLSSHKSIHVKKMLREKGVDIIFLPPYSPDMNPIEMTWSKLKTYLRKKKAKTDKALFKAVRAGLNKITKSDCVNWINHMGYASLLNC